MPFAAAAIGLGVAGAVGGAVISSQGAQAAAKTQANAANNATQVQQNEFNQTQQNLAPFLGSGTNALSALNIGLGLPGVGPSTPYDQITDDQRNAAWLKIAQMNGGNLDAARAQFGQLASRGHLLDVLQQPAAGVPAGSLTKPFSLADFQSSPGYQFQLQQGISAIDNSASARGVSGNTLRDLTAYGTGLANQDYYNAYNVYTNRQNQLFNYLSSLSGSGQNAAANLGGFGAQVAGQIGNNITGAGNALAAGQAASANAFGRGLNNLSDISQLAFLSQQDPQQNQQQNIIQQQQQQDLQQQLQGTVGFFPQFSNTGTL